MKGEKSMKKFKRIGSVILAFALAFGGAFDMMPQQEVRAADITGSSGIYIYSDGTVSTEWSESAIAHIGSQGSYDSITVSENTVTIKNLNTGGDLSFYADYNFVFEGTNTVTSKFEDEGGVCVDSSCTITMAEGATLTATQVVQVYDSYTVNVITLGENTVTSPELNTSTTETVFTDNVTFSNSSSAASGTDTAAAATYTIKFDGNGATSGSMDSQTFTEGGSLTLTANAFARTGYTFTGWNTKADGTGTAYADKAALTNITADTTLYAQWQIVPQDQTISLAKTSFKIKYKTLKKKKQTITLKATSSSGTAVAFGTAAVKGTSKKLTKAAKKKIKFYKSTGKITIKKGLSKGKYTLTIPVSVAASTGYNAASDTINVTIKVK